MRTDLSNIIKVYDDIFQDLEQIKTKLLQNLKDTLKKCSNIDAINFRVKSEKSFLGKVKIMGKDEVLKYPHPFREVQDIIGGRVIVYYKSDIEPIVRELENNYNRVEKIKIVPDDEKEFGYEGFHFIFFTPTHIYNPYRDNINIPYFFELQVKTLYQHAWAQSEHGLGYKSGCDLPPLIKRKLAFLAAQSWGADQILEELVNDVESINQK